MLNLLLVKFKSDRRRGYWTLRLSIDLEHVGCLDESLEVAEKGLLDPWVRAGSIVALQRRVLRLGKPPRRWKTPGFLNSINRKIVEVIHFISYKFLRVTTLHFSYSLRISVSCYSFRFTLLDDYVGSCSGQTSQLQNRGEECLLW